VAALLITNVALGILTRAAPQLNLFGIGFPITLGVGLLVIAMTLPYLNDAGAKPVFRWHRTRAANAAHMVAAARTSQTGKLAGSTSGCATIAKFNNHPVDFWFP
jgi:hypothetical protein